MRTIRGGEYDGFGGRRFAHMFAVAIALMLASAPVVYAAYAHIDANDKGTSYLWVYWDNHEPSTVRKLSGIATLYYWVLWTANLQHWEEGGEDFFYANYAPDDNDDCMQVTDYRYKIKGLNDDTTHYVKVWAYEAYVVDVDICPYSFDEGTKTGISQMCTDDGGGQYCEEKTLDAGGAPPPSGGCPYLSPAGSTGFVSDNSILPQAKESQTDGTDYYRIQQSLTESNGYYVMTINEGAPMHDYIDYVELMTVDHASSTSVVVAPDGEVMNYQSAYTLSPYSVLTSNNTNVTSYLTAADTTNFVADGDDNLTMYFDPIDLPGRGSNLLYNPFMYGKLKIPVEVLIDGAGGPQWTEVDAFYPRDQFYLGGVNLSGYNIEDGKLRIQVKDGTEIDFLALDETPYSLMDMDIDTLSFSYAFLSDESGNGTMSALVSDDGSHVDISGSVILIILFEAKDLTGEVRDFILKINGHYITQY